MAERLTKIERFYVQAHLDTDVAVLAKELKKPKATVQTYVDNVKKSLVEDEKAAQEKAAREKIAITTTTTKKPDDDFMVKKRGAIIMTQVASEKGDEARQNSPDPLDKPFIHRIRNGK
jgi:hypothetical protein